MATSFQAKLKFQNIPEKVLEEFEFTGGLITDKHETKLEPTQSPDLTNVLLNDTGSVKTRNGYLRYNGNPIGIASDTSETGASAGTLGITTTGTYVAQTFIPSGAISVVQVDVYLALANVANQQYIRVELWSTSAGVPSALLTNGQAQIKLVTDASETAYSFRFKEPVALSAATTYAIVVKPFVRGSSSSVNQVNVHRRGATYANGQVYTSTDGALTWTGAASQDLKFNVYSGGNTGNTGLIRYYGPSGIQQLFAKFGSTLYRGNDGTGALTAITMPSGVTLNSTNFIDHCVVNDTLLVVDRENRIKKYNGSTNANYSTGTITATNGSATITGSGTSWATTTNAEAKEYIQLPDSKWYKITAIASDTSMTIELAYQGATLAGQSYVISPWGEVQGKLNSSTAVTGLTRPTPDFIENHLNRVWTLDGNSLRFSVLDTSVTEENFNDWDTSSNSGEIIIPGNNGDTGTGLYSLNGYLYIFQRHAIWELLGTSLNNFELRNISNEVGMVDKRTLVEYDRYLIFFAGKNEGVYLFDGTNLKNITKNRINSLVATWGSTTSPSASLWNNKYIISYPTSADTYNTEAIFYDIDKDVWGKHDNVFAATWSTWKGGTDTGQIYFASSNQGSIYRWDTGGHDDGYEITTRYDTPSIGFGGNMNDKTVKKFFLQQLALGDWDMSITQLSDIDATEIVSEVNLSDGSSSLWGVAVWGVDEWGSEGTLITTRVAEFQGIAKYFKYRFEQTGYDEGVEILGLTGTARVRRLN